MPVYRRQGAATDSKKVAEARGEVGAELVRTQNY